MLQIKSLYGPVTLSMKLYQCTNCHAVFRSESDKDAHSSIGPAHVEIREYELEEFLTRFLVAA